MSQIANSGFQNPRSNPQSGDSSSKLALGLLNFTGGFTEARNETQSKRIRIPVGYIARFAEPVAPAKQPVTSIQLRMTEPVVFVTYTLEAISRATLR